MAHFYRTVNRMVKRISLESEDDDQDIRRESARSGSIEGPVNRSIMRGDYGEGAPRGSLDQPGLSRINGSGNSSRGPGSFTTIKMTFIKVQFHVFT